MARLLAEKARWVWEQTLLIHQRVPETRLASSLSALEILVALILRFRALNPCWAGRGTFFAGLIGMRDYPLSCL